MTLNGIEPFYISKSSKSRARVEMHLNIPPELVLKVLNNSIDKFPLGWYLGSPFGFKGKEFFGEVSDYNFMIYQGKRGRRYIIEDSYNDDAELYGKVYSMPYGSKIEAKFSVTSSFETIGVISIFGLITLLVFIYLLDFFTSQESSVDIQPIFIALVLLVAFFVGLIIQKALKSSIEDKVK